MKKLSSLLVLILIALMMFVSCNNSTPTKEEPAKLEGRDATPEDAMLIAHIFSAVTQIKLQILHNSTPNNVDTVGYTLIFEDEGCTVDVQVSKDEIVSVTLVGSATIIDDPGIITYECNLKDGTKIERSSHTVQASLTLNTTNINQPYEVQEAIIDGEKVNNLDTLLNAAFNSQSV